MASGCQGTPFFRRYDRELVFETGDFVKEELAGGYPRTTRSFLAENLHTLLAQKYTSRSTLIKLNLMKYDTPCATNRGATKKDYGNPNGIQIHWMIPKLSSPGVTYTKPFILA